MRPSMQNWPIIKLTEERDEFINQVVEASIQRIEYAVEKRGGLSEAIAKTYYLEKIRLTEKPWRVDPEDEKEFWRDIKAKMLINEQETNTEKRSKNDKKLLRKIVTRYANEIAGRFNVRTYNFAQKLVPRAFRWFLNAASYRNISRFKILSSRHNFRDRIHLRGDLELIKSLDQKGTIILVPTHFSNLDSFLIGYALSELDLPPFLYGAGLNLYNNKIAGYYFDRLGAYKVDRRKKNRFYLETLKSYSRIGIKRGCHSLFYPRGTRSRDGSLEKHLKLGLLGTALEAQFSMLEEAKNGEAKKVFILPSVTSYHFVLEALSLIKEHLKRSGRERYFIENDEFSSFRKTIKFVWEFLSKGSHITLSFGKPMDIFGNYVDKEGNSIDKKGKPINIRKYFITGGELQYSPQRESQYTRMLGERISQEYKKFNVVFSSHVVAFVAFQEIQKRFNHLDLYGLMRLPEDSCMIPYEDFKSAVSEIKNKLHLLESEGKVLLSNRFEMEIDDFIKRGIRNVGQFHAKHVLKFTKTGNVTSQNMNLLYFYHNRLEGYEL